MAFATDPQASPVDDPTHAVHAEEDAAFQDWQQEEERRKKYINSVLERRAREEASITSNIGDLPKSELSKRVAKTNLLDINTSFKPGAPITVPMTDDDVQKANSRNAIDNEVRIREEQPHNFVSNPGASFSARAGAFVGSLLDPIKLLALFLAWLFYRWIMRPLSKEELARNAGNIDPHISSFKLPEDSLPPARTGSKINSDGQAKEQFRQLQIEAKDMYLDGYIRSEVIEFLLKRGLSLEAAQAVADNGNGSDQSIYPSDARNISALNKSKVGLFQNVKDAFFLTKCMEQVRHVVMPHRAHLAEEFCSTTKPFLLAFRDKGASYDAAVNMVCMLVLEKKKDFGKIDDGDMRGIRAVMTAMNYCASFAMRWPSHEHAPAMAEAFAKHKNELDSDPIVKSWEQMGIAPWEAGA